MITAKIKDVLSDRGVAMGRVVGLGSDGANVMVGRKAGVAQHLCQNDCPYLQHSLWCTQNGTGCS